MNSHGRKRLKHQDDSLDGASVFQSGISLTEDLGAEPPRKAEAAAKLRELLVSAWVLNLRLDAALVTKLSYYITESEGTGVSDLAVEASMVYPCCCLYGYCSSYCIGNLSQFFD